MEMLSGYKRNVEDFETAPQACCPKCRAGANCHRVERSPGLTISTCLCGFQSFHRTVKPLEPAEPRKFCPGCGTAIHYTSTNCRPCSQALQRKRRAKNYCAGCGKQITAGAVHCRSCAMLTRCQREREEAKA